jgi:hypothetical protein
MNRGLILLLVLLFNSSSAVYAGDAKSSKGAKNAVVSNYTGYYTLRYSNVNNSLQVLQLPDGKIKFDLLALLMTGDSPRNGEVRGIVTIKDGVAVYDVDGCKVNFKFEGNKVSVKVNDVDACAFGVYVTADGTYTKRDSKAPKFDF